MSGVRGGNGLGNGHSISLGTNGHYSANAAFSSAGSYTVENLTITATSSAGIAFDMANGGTLTGVTVMGEFNMGVYTGSNVTVSGCTFRLNGGSSYGVYTAETVTGTNVSISNNTFTGTRAFQQAVYLENGNAAITGSTFNNTGSWGVYTESNTIENVSITNNTFNSPYAAMLRNGDTFTGNTVNSANGISVASSNANVSGNIFTGETAMEIHISAKVSENNIGTSKVGVYPTFENTVKADLSNNYWGGGEPAADQIINGGTVEKPVTVEVNSYYKTNTNRTLSNLSASQNAVAEVNGEYYSSLTDAVFNAVQQGTPVKVLKNVSAAEINSIAMPATLDMNGNTIIPIGGNVSSTLSSNAGILTIKNIGAKKAGFTLTTGITATVDANGITVTAAEFNPAAPYGYSKPIHTSLGDYNFTIFLDVADNDKGAVIIDNNGLGRLGGSHMVTGHYESLSAFEQATKTKVYTITETHNGSIVTNTFVVGSVNDMTLKCNGFYETFIPERILVKNAITGVENWLTTKEEFTSTEGSTIVTIQNAFLRKLAVGEYKVTLYYKDGLSATGSIYVSSNYYADTSNPKTGDSIFMAMSVMTFSAAALAVLLLGKKKRA